MRVVLINPNVFQINQPLPPVEISDHMGLAYIAATLRGKGHWCEIIDADLLNIDSFQVVELCRDMVPDLIGLTIVHDSVPSASSIIKELRKWFVVPIFVGGHMPTIAGSATFSHFPDIDYILTGEVEDTINLFVENVYTSRKHIQIPNLICKDSPEISNIKQYSSTPDLEKVPWPSRDYVNKIVERQNYYGLPRALRISSSRGCHGACFFCDINMFYRKCGLKRVWRARAIKDVVKEIEWLQKKYDVDIFYFSDDNFIGPNDVALERANEFYEEIVEAGLKIRFTISTRMDGVTDVICKLLKKVGLVHIGVGLENICNNALMKFNKETNNGCLLDVISICHQYDISLSLFMILYHPFTTVEEIKMNWQLLQNIGYFDSHVKKRNAYDILANSILVVRRYSYMESILKREQLHRGYYQHNPMYVKYRFYDRRIEPMIRKVMRLVNGDENNAECHFRTTLDEALRIPISLRANE